MINPQFRSDHEPDSASSPHLHELQLLKPPSMHQIQPSSQRQQGPSAYNMWKKPKSSSAEASSEITHSFSLSAKNKLSGDLSCELGLGVGENPRRVCRICQRHFSSGRALGGHMRVHGPLFQPAGSKRKLNSADLHGMSSFEDGFSEKEVGKVEPIMNSLTESAGEAVEDELHSEADVHEDDRNDGVDEYSMRSHREEPSSTSLEFAELVDDGHLASSKRNPLYKLRHNPKRSRRFAEDDFAMEMLLAEHGAGAIQRPRVCSECGKAFWSWKALFGHMRCHPEREWRGILPPEDSSVHEGRSLFGGKKPSSVSRFSESSDYELESDVENRVYGEEGGARRASYESKEGALQMLEEDEVTEEELAIMRRKIGEGDMYGQDSKEQGAGNGREDNWNPRWPPTGKRSRRKSMEGKAESLQQLSTYAHQEEPALTSESASLVELEEEHYVETPNFLLMLAEAARKIEQDTAQVRKNLVQLHPDIMPQDKHEAESFLAFNEKQSVAAASSTSGIVKFECSTCKKSFNSHQALGGHRASHRKMKGCFAQTTLGADEMGFGEYDSTRDELSLRAAWQGADAVHEKDHSHLAEKGKKQQTKGHECSVCHRMFSTGQALGGHKRCHYIGEKVVEAVSVTSSNKQLYEEGLSSKLDEGGSILDLNLPAPEDSEVACASAELRLFHGERDEREGNWTMQGNSEEISLAPWKVLGSQKSGSWELGGSWAMGPAMAY